MGKNEWLHCIEKHLLLELCRGSSYYDDVIDIFTRKNQRTDLIYKK